MNGAAKQGFIPERNIYDFILLMFMSNENFKTWKA